MYKVDESCSQRQPYVRCCLSVCSHNQFSAKPIKLNGYNIAFCHKDKYVRRAQPQLRGTESAVGVSSLSLV